MKIYLFCSGGMSTSLLAQRMQQVGESKGMSLEVEAYPENIIEKIVEEKHPDCILLGPQVRYLFRKINEQYGKEIPVGVMDMMDFGRMNGEAVLHQAIVLMNDFKETALH